MRFVVGGVAGAYIGFLLRPSIPLVGQLPVMVVLTSGQYLKGFDQLFIPTAQTSFSYVVAGLIIGILVAMFFKPKAAVAPAAPGNVFSHIDSAPGIAAGRPIGKFLACMAVLVAIVAVVIGFGSIATLIAFMKSKFTPSHPAASVATTRHPTQREKFRADLREQRAEAAEEARAFGGQENNEFATRPAPPPVMQGGVYLAGGPVSVPSVLYKVDPDYTEEARQARISGTVIVSLIVGADGRPRDIRIVRGMGRGLDEKAAEAVAQWRFRPGLKEGSAVPVRATIEVKFRML